MASNSFGTIFRYTTWGESHGPAVGVVIDGCPAGVALDEGWVNEALARRAPGSTPYGTARKEADTCEILSGVFEGRTTGAPVSIMIRNRDADSGAYEDIARLYRPGHANFTYLAKYGIFDHRGGGRASARETAARVAAGAVARGLLAQTDIRVSAWLCGIGGYEAQPAEPEEAARFARRSALFAPSAQAEDALARQIALAQKDGDSIGGTVGFYVSGVPAGLGDPVYEKLEARLAYAMMSIPASKGFEIGEGFAASSLRGSACNDAFARGRGGEVVTLTNRAGGTLGGISTGMPVYGRVAFKPTPSIRLPQATLDTDGNTAELQLPPGSRHDPCVAVRAVPVVEAMCLVVLADAWLMQRLARYGEENTAVAP